MNKLGLGTVQFGQAYGVSNARGQVPAAEVAAILKRAAAGGIGVLDTAANYGEAESVLAAMDLSQFRIVTKTIGLGHGLDAVIDRARQSAQTLKADLLLVHAASDLADGGCCGRRCSSSKAMAWSAASAFRPMSPTIPWPWRRASGPM